MGQGDGCAHHPSFRRPRRGRKGRHHQGDHRASEPARFPRGGVAGAHGARKDAGFHAEVHLPLSVRGGNHRVRPQLVQQGRVEPVMGFCTEEEHERFLFQCPHVENWLAETGIILIKIWLEVGMEEQERRFRVRIADPLRQWKLSPMDTESYKRWYAYSRARDQMFDATDTEHAPWYILQSNDKRRARLNGIAHILASIPYEKIKRPKVKLPKRPKHGAYDDHAVLRNRRFIAERY